MPDSEAKRAWIKENTVPLGMKLNKNTDADIIDWLDRQENRQGAIKNLIRAAIKKEQKKSR